MGRRIESLKQNLYETTRGIKQNPMEAVMAGVTAATPIVVTAEIAHPQEAKAQALFSDIEGNRYQYAIERLAQEGFVDGFPDGSFRPEEPVVREQFAKMISNTLILEVESVDTAPFKDVATVYNQNDIKYPGGYVKKVAEYGITIGYPDGTFRPREDITLGQAASMIVRGMAQEGTLQTPPASFKGTIPFSHDPHWRNLVTLEYNRLHTNIENWGQDFDHWKHATRGELAQMLWNMFELNHDEQTGFMGARLENGQYTLRHPDGYNVQLNAVEGFTPDERLYVPNDLSPRNFQDFGNYADWDNIINNPTHPIAGYSYDKNDEAESRDFFTNAQLGMFDWRVLQGQEVIIPGIGKLVGSERRSVVALLINAEEDVVAFDEEELGQVKIKRGFTATGPVFNLENKEKIMEAEEVLGGHWIHRQGPENPSYDGITDHPENAREVLYVAAVYRQWGHNDDGSERRQFQLIRSGIFNVAK